MLFDEKYSYEVLNSNIDDDLFEMARDLGLNDEDSISNKWYLFSVFYALAKNFDLISAKSFGDIVTYYMTGVKLDTSGKFYKKDQIIDDLDDIIYEAYDLDGDDIENIKALFTDIFELFDEMYEKYTYKTEQLLIRVSVPTKHKFNQIDGKTASEKLDLLMTAYENNYK